MQTTSNLLSPELLARLEKMELVSRKIFRGRMKGERRSRAEGPERRVRRLPQLRARRRPAIHRLEHLRPARKALPEAVPRGRGPALLRPDRRQRVDGFRRADQAPLRPAVGRRAGVHRPGPRRSGQDRDARPVGPRRRRPSFAAGGACGGCSTTSRSFEPAGPSRWPKA